jgi:hypothetical protein
VADYRDNSDPGIPANAQHLGDGYAALDAAHNHFEKVMRVVDHPHVNRHMKKMCGVLRKALNETNACFSKNYPELEPLHEKDFDASGADQPDAGGGADMDADASDALPEEEKALVLSALGRMRTEVAEMRRGTERLLRR